MRVLVCISLASGCTIWPEEFDLLGDLGMDTGIIAGRGVGAAEFAWQVGASGCDAAGVDRVAVTIGSTEATFDCLDGQAIMQASEGFYQTVVATGFDYGGLARFEGGLAGVEIVEDAVTPIGTFRLQARTGELLATWSFSNGLLCGPNGVVELNLALLRDDRIEYELFTPCNDGLEVLPGIRAGVYTASVLGNDANGLPIFEADAPVTVPEGEQVRVDFVLTPRQR